MVFPHKLRQILAFLFIGALLFLSYYNLSGVELGRAVLVIEEDIMGSFFFNEHPQSRIVAFGFTLVGALGLLYGVQLAKPAEQAISVLALVSAIGIVFSGNFITLFIFWELLTFTTAGLIFCKGDQQAITMGARFLYFHLAGGLIVFLGILQHYFAAGNFLLTSPQAGLIFFIIGFGFKAAFLPFHLWVAWGYPSATFYSSVLLAGLTTKIGVFALTRILPPNEFILLMGASMSLVGVSCALLQHNMRRLLSYHIISQVGYMVAAAGLGTAIAVDGGLLHVVNHMLYKALLFMSAGAVFLATGMEDTHDLMHEDSREEEKEKRYIWKAMPLVTIGAIVGALSISGVPLFSGYVSKYLLKNAMYGAGPAEWMLLIASIGTAASFCKFVYFGFIKAKAKIINPLPVTLQAAIVAASFFSVLLGVYPQFISTLVPHGSSLDVYSPLGVWETMQLIIVGMLVFLNIAKPLKKGIHVPYWLSIEGVLFAPMARYIYNMISNSGAKLETSLNDFFVKTGSAFLELCRMMTSFEHGLNRFYTEKSSKGIHDLGKAMGNLDRQLESLYTTRTSQGIKSLSNLMRSLDYELGSFQRSGANIKKFSNKIPDLENSSSVVLRIKEIRASLQESGSTGDEFDPTEWSIRNLSFDQLLMISLLGMVILVFFYFSWTRGII